MACAMILVLITHIGLVTILQKLPAKIEAIKLYWRVENPLFRQNYFVCSYSEMLKQIE
jgi:hypothetical protein